MPFKDRDTLSFLRAPDHDLIFGEAMSGDEFVGVLAESHIADLRICLNGVQRRFAVDVPNFNAFVGVAAARVQGSVGMRRPGKSADCCSMFSIILQRIGSV